MANRKTSGKNGRKAPAQNAARSAAKKAGRKPAAKRGPARKAAASPSPARRGTVKKVIHQVREPLSLIQTLREEGLANAMSFLTLASGVASGAARNFRAEAIRPQLGEIISSLGFAMREDLERLQDRVGDLEQRLSELEYAALRAIGEDE